MSVKNVVTHLDSVVSDRELYNECENVVTRLDSS